MKPTKQIPPECLFSDRGAGECWGCPAIFCKHVRTPFQSRTETEEVALRAAARVMGGKVRGYRPRGVTVVEIAADLVVRLLATVKDFKLAQAAEAVKLGLATPGQAARWAGVGERKFRDYLSRAQTGTKEEEPLQDDGPASGEDPGQEAGGR